MATVRAVGRAVENAAAAQTTRRFILFVPKWFDPSGDELRVTS